MLMHVASLRMGRGCGANHLRVVADPVQGRTCRTRSDGTIPGLVTESLMRMLLDVDATVVPGCQVSQLAKRIRLLHRTCPTGTTH